jgi:hypothetical protein
VRKLRIWEALPNCDWAKYKQAVMEANKRADE